LKHKRRRNPLRIIKVRRLIRVRDEEIKRCFGASLVDLGPVLLTSEVALMLAFEQGIVGRWCQRGRLFALVVTEADRGRGSFHQYRVPKWALADLVGGEPDDLCPLLKPQHVAEQLGLRRKSSHSTKEFLERHKIPYIKIGPSYRIPQRAVQARLPKPAPEKAGMPVCTETFTAINWPPHMWAPPPSGAKVISYLFGLHKDNLLGARTDEIAEAVESSDSSFRMHRCFRTCRNIIGTLILQPKRGFWSLNPQFPKNPRFVKTPADIADDQSLGRSEKGT